MVRVDFGEPVAGLRLHRESHLVLVTRGHRFDYEILRELLCSDTEPGYVGMVGSSRRVRAALVQLAAEGVPFGRLAEIHAPIGLDIGAEKPEEIAVATAAELVRSRRGGSGAPLRDRARVVARWLQ